jgi:acyl-coenzyme A thioesterase PaaI-like protein
MSNAVIGFFKWPLISVFETSKFILGSIIATIPLILKVSFSKKGFGSIKKFDDLHLFLSNLPLGIDVFSGIVCFFAPYTANIGGKVVELSRERCVITMEEQPWLKNPFNSIHAIALANIGEFASGLVMLTNLQHLKHLKGIPNRIDTVYYKKARGTVTAKSDQKNQKNSNFRALSDIDKDQEFNVETVVTDSQGDLVSRTTVTWQLKVNVGKIVGTGSGGSGEGGGIGNEKRKD